MISSEIQELLQQQISAEFFASNLYLQMAAILNDLGYQGFTCKMIRQAKEEHCHGMRIFKFMLDCDAKPIIQQIDSPPLLFGGNMEYSARDMFDKAFEHEQFITGMIKSIIKKAIETEDMAVISFMQWFIDEQVQEEKDAFGILQKIDLIGDDNAALLALDREINEDEKEDDFDLDDLE